MSKRSNMRLLPLFVSIALIGTAAGATVPAGQCPWTPLQVSEPTTCISPAMRIDDGAFGRPSHKQRQEQAVDQSAWEGPEHCVNGACIFSNQDIGGGIVLVTDPSHAKKTLDFPDLIEPNVNSPPFLVTEVPGKGVALVANRTIRKGEIIMMRSPAMVIQSAPHAKIEATARSLLYDQAIEKLPGPRRDAFMGQMGKDVYDKVETNCFQMYIGSGNGSSHLGCFPEISRFNHDCRPNIHYRIDNMTHTTIAARDVPPGEELSISYIDLLLTKAQRARRLLVRWGFRCACAHCSMGKRETAASDARLRRIARLKADLENFNETLVRADTGARLVALYEAERLHTYLGKAYTRAALNFALFGEAERAREYARVAVEALEREYGPRVADARAMRVLADDPRKHWTWGRRRRRGRPRL